MAKLFKNTFGVSGTETEINLFIESAIKIGWTFIHDVSAKYKLYFIHNWSVYKKEGNFNRVYEERIGSTFICISTLEGWSKAIELASEEEEVESIPEYVECTHFPNLSFIKGKIYKIKSSIIDSELAGAHSIYEWHFNKKYFTPSTLEAFQSQELLEEAKRKYPVGTKYKNVEYLGSIFEVQEGSFVFDDDKIIIFENGQPCVWNAGQWTEIIPLEPSRYTVEEFINKIKELK